MRRSFVIISCCLLLAICLHAKTIHVPADQSTIQAGINAANTADTVLVSPGTYYEQINFMGKNIMVKSQSGPGVTIIDASHGSGPVVRFVSGEGRQATLQGFTIQNGSVCCNTYEGGGVEIRNSSPSIISNTIRNNVGGIEGGGINASFGGPIIRGNTITGNTVALFGGTGVGGISIGGDSSPYAQIISNVIKGNYGVGFGGGIELFAAGGVLILNNTISNNSAGTKGGGIDMVNNSNEVIVQNVFTNNAAPSGSELNFSVPFSDPGIVLVNNTISSNASGSDAAVFAEVYNSDAQIVNNVIVASGSQAALLCNRNYHYGTPIVQNNDAYSPQGTSYAGDCTGFGGMNGNISVNPIFTSPPSNLRLRDDSGVIDAGDNNAPNLPATDFAGARRIINGHNGQTAVVDMGAYEFIPVVLSPTSLGFGTHPIGSHTPKTVRLTNNLSQTLSISSITTTGDYSYSSACGSTVPPRTGCNITVTFTPTQVGKRTGTLTITDVAGNSPQLVSLTGTGQ